MVDEQLSGALRDLPGKVLNVPVEERQLIFRNVSSVLKNPVYQIKTKTRKNATFECLDYQIPVTQLKGAKG
ncbi:uncharacterized protein LOC108030938 isoform X2 [Drosophila biarmipes]|uniref:uncharacterized protein LOC108030938 isoform X2 n=1 Tax=Drosophila biarmipes TaxID=125945 RepID=UPI0021CC6BDB|nr:uncharacterized protein LOC108030938 isoform X2 [Drosophila biarmipes]